MQIHHSKRRFIAAVVFLLAAESFLSVESDGAVPPYSCDPADPSTSSLPFCDRNLPVKTRTEDLVARLTVDEKVSQLVNSAAAVPRLNVSAYEWWSEALHGVSKHGRGVRFNGTIKAATMFPQFILSAASFDADLWYRIAKAIGEEARAVFNVGQAKGLTFWAPNINIFRDPRWGRGQETTGEDPLVAGKFAAAYIRGIQGDSFTGGDLKEGHLKTSACCKHYTAHDLDNWNNMTRYIFNAKVTIQDLADTFQPPFKACVEQGGASSIMCAYNQVNGIPSCADYNLLTKTARQEWGFQGYIASDCDAVDIIYSQQGYVKEPEDAVALVLKAGKFSMDLNCGSFLSKYTKSAITKKKISESDIDTALHNLFSIRMRLGLFDGDPRKLQYGGLGATSVCSQDHLNLALEATRSSVVLLKNDGGLLPLDKSKTASLAIIGPTANDSGIFVGNYEGSPCRNVSILQAIQSKYIAGASYHPGCDFVNCTLPKIDEAAAVAEQADYVLLVMGLDQTQEREKHDRVELGLPGRQEELITTMAKVAKRPVVLVLLCGGPVDISFAKGNPKIGAILWAGYPGEAGGVAVAETLFSDNNPEGRLPVTWYPKDFAEVPMTDMRMRAYPSEGYPGRTYRFYTGPKVYEFGYGLSYNNYSYKFSSVSQSKLLLNTSSSQKNRAQKCGSLRSISVSELGPKTCDSIKFSAKLSVQNLGKLPGKRPLLLFVRSEERVGSGSPRKQLIGFQTVELGPGQNREYEFMVNPCEHLSYANEDGLMVVEDGKIWLEVGGEEYPMNVEFGDKMCKYN